MQILESKALYNIDCDGMLMINGKNSSCKYSNNGSDAACGTWCPLLIPASQIHELDWGSGGKRPEGAVAICLCGCMPVALIRNKK